MTGAPRPIEIRVDPWPDEAALGALWLSAWGAPMRDGYRSVLEHSLAHLGAYDGARLVGFVNVAWDGGIHATIFDTCVEADCRRRGVGVALVRRAVEVARERGAEYLHVDYEVRLAGFYRQCGFAPTEAGLIRLRSPDGPGASSSS